MYILLITFISGLLLPSCNTGQMIKKKSKARRIQRKEIISADSSVQIPSRIFTPEMVGLIKKGQPYSELFRHTTGENFAQGASPRYNKIPIQKWQKLISPFAPVSVTGGAWNRRGECPFCGKPFEGCSMSLDEFLETPFQAKTECCRNIVYAKKKDMPADYPAKPNHTETIPHLDGTVFNYEFYVPPGKEKDRNNWFCSAGEVWRARQRHVIDIFFPYSSAVFNNNDEKAALQLAAIFDRLADVVPGYPLYDNMMPHGLARGRDEKKYLTREEFLSVTRPQRFEKPFWHRWENWHFDKLPASSRYGGWTDGVMMFAGILAASFDLIRDRPEIKAWSKSKYGDPDAFEKRVMERVFKEYQLLTKAVPATRHNTNWTWIRGAVAFGILMQDEYYLKEVFRILEANIINNYFSDGLSTEGSFGYAQLLRRLINNLWIVEHFSGIDLTKKYPSLKQIKELGDYPIQTLYNVESMHGDECARFFATQRKHINPPAPNAVDYPAHEKSLCFPETGLVCLRAGSPGSRMETIMDFQTVSTSHTHNGRLNVQLFYEGINLLPDFGYSTYLANLSKSPCKDYKYNFKALPIKPPSRNFRKAYVKQPQSHCTALVDGVNHKRGPATFHRFLGGQNLPDPGYSVQFAEADARAVFTTSISHKKGEIVIQNPIKKIDRFRRQLITVTLPNGRSVMIDIFRIKGGRRHEIYWHVPAEKAKTSLGVPEKLKHKTVQDYMRSIHGDPPVKTKGPSLDSALQYLNSPERWKNPGKVWQMEWLIQPSKFEPASQKGRKKYKKWKKILHDAKLRIWGFVNGDRVENDEIITARGIWPSGMMEENRRGDVFAFIDAMDFIVASRWSEKEPLKSTFVHVLEPSNPDQQPTVDKVVELKGETSEAADGCAVRLKILKENTEKTSDLLVATTVNGGDFQSKDLKLKGRLGMVCPDNSSLLLYDGTELHTKDFGVELETGWHLKLVKVLGDLTGHSEESALIVDSTRPLPTDQTLAGQMLTVYHQISDLHTTGYTIQSIQKLSKNRYRINLRGNPPFIQFRTCVRKLDKQNPNYVYGSTHNSKGAANGIFQGRCIRFPRTGFSSSVKAILWGKKSGFDLIEMKTSPKDADIAIGDPYIIHTIKPGDMVVIPSLFAVRQREKNNLRVFTTGTAILGIPACYQAVSLVSGGKTIDFTHKKSENQLKIKINRQALKNGCAILKLNTKK